MPMIFSKPQLMLWGANKITDHNRSELGISVERIERSSRMANGTLRKYVIADKRTFSMSWDMLPSKTIYTVDGFYGADDIETFYNTTVGAFVLTLNYTGLAAKLHTVVMSDFSKDLVGRGRYDMYNVTVSLEEV